MNSRALFIERITKYREKKIKKWNKKSSKKGRARAERLAEAVKHLRPEKAEYFLYTQDKLKLSLR